MNFWFLPQSKSVTKTNTIQRRAGPPPPCDELWDKILDMKWDRVLDHIHHSPQDAEWQDGHLNETPLYLACQQSSPLEVIQAIIQVYPDALLIPSRANQDLPLHISCRYQAPIQVLKELLHLYPETAMEQTRWGSIPLMALWEFRSNDMSAIEEAEFWDKVHVLLLAVARVREDPQFLLNDSDDPQSRTTLSSSKRRRLRRSLSNHSPPPPADDDEPPSRSSRTRETAWIDNSLEAFTSSSPNTNEEEEPLMVHAAVSQGALRCPVEILQHVLRRWPDQVKIKDKGGQLPLHIAVGPTSWCSSGSAKRKYKPREQHFLHLLLEAYPEAANVRITIRNTKHSSDDDDDETDNHDHGRYPLHSAIANRHSWSGGVQELFLAASHVVLIQDPYTKLYPFQLAALPVRGTAVELDTIYHLLRANPAVLTLMDLSPPPIDTATTGTLRTYGQMDSPTVVEVGPLQPVTRSNQSTRLSDNALMGTLSAIVIGSVAALLFSE